jgi:Family of unknown function (DUF5709)
MTDDQAYDADEESPDLEDDGVLDPSDTLDGNLGDDALDEANQAPERWSAGQRYGTTLAEERTGESLDQLLAEEEPDIDADAYADADASASRTYGADPEAGPLIADDDGVRSDEEPDLVAHAGERFGRAPAEEAAVHVIDESDLDGDSGAAR